MLQHFSTYISSYVSQCQTSSSAAAFHSEFPNLPTLTWNNEFSSFIPVVENTESTSLKTIIGDLKPLILTVISTLANFLNAAILVLDYIRSLFDFFILSNTPESNGTNMTSVISSKISFLAQCIRYHNIHFVQLILNNSELFSDEDVKTAFDSVDVNAIDALANAQLNNDPLVIFLNTTAEGIIYASKLLSSCESLEVLPNQASWIATLLGRYWNTASQTTLSLQSALETINSLNTKISSSSSSLSATLESAEQSAESSEESAQDQEQESQYTDYNVFIQHSITQAQHFFNIAYSLPQLNTDSKSSNNSSSSFLSVKSPNSIVPFSLSFDTSFFSNKNGKQSFTAAPSLVPSSASAISLAHLQLSYASERSALDILSLSSENSTEAVENTQSENNKASSQSTSETHNALTGKDSVYLVHRIYLSLSVLFQRLIDKANNSNNRGSTEESTGSDAEEEYEGQLPSSEWLNLLLADIHSLFELLFRSDESHTSSEHTSQTSSINSSLLLSTPSTSFSSLPSVFLIEAVTAIILGSSFLLTSLRTSSQLNLWSPSDTTDISTKHKYFLQMTLRHARSAIDRAPLPFVGRHLLSGIASSVLTNDLALLQNTINAEGLVLILTYSIIFIPILCFSIINFF